jgi:cysteine desulfurase / selenocysteine lyase
MSVEAEEMSYDPVEVKRRFPLFERNDGLVYLDNAATAQKPQEVLDALLGYYLEDNANVHRGMYDLARRATEAYEAARERVARFVHAASSSEVVWVRGTTEAINLVASSWGGEHLSEGDEILLTVVEHHSNLVPWQLVAERTGARIRFLDIDADGRLRLEELGGALSDRTRVVALGHVSNALGTIHPIAEIAARAHDVGAVVLVDGAQGAPHLDVDVQALGCDFYTLSGHKLGAPMGIGALWARRELLDAMRPYQGGGEMIDYVGLEHSTWADVPHKFEAGTPNVGGAVALAAALDFLDDLGAESRHAHERSLVEHGLEQLAGVDGLRLFGPPDPGGRIAVFSFELEGVHPHDVATILDEAGVAVRAGHHCCQPLMRRLEVPATTRASCWVYNTPDDLDRLVDALRSAQKVFA